MVHVHSCVKFLPSFAYFLPCCLWKC